MFSATTCTVNVQNDAMTILPDVLEEVSFPFSSTKVAAGHTFALDEGLFTY